MRKLFFVGGVIVLLFSFSLQTAHPLVLSPFDRINAQNIRLIKKIVDFFSNKKSKKISYDLFKKKLDTIQEQKEPQKSLERQR